MRKDELGGEWRERMIEDGEWDAGETLLRLSRLRRRRDKLVAEFGGAAVDADVGGHLGRLPAARQAPSDRLRLESGRDEPARALACSTSSAARRSSSSRACRRSRRCGSTRSSRAQNPTGSIKDRVAKSMIEAAEASGELEPGRELLEPTSGNTGISLALIAKLKGYPLTCVMPENATEERRRMLRLFGAEIVDSPGAEGSNGAVRLALELAERDSRYFMPFQYANEANPRAHYEGTGAEIAEALDRVDVLVAGLGTGGTLMGAASGCASRSRTSSSRRPSRSPATR